MVVLCAADWDAALDDVSPSLSREERERYQHLFEKFGRKADGASTETAAAAVVPGRKAKHSKGKPSS